MSPSEQLIPSLLVYREVLEGDLRKLRAKSNDDKKAGGGARDLRFDWKTFRPVMLKIFSQDGIGQGKKPIHTATISYLDSDGQPQTTSMEYWPPTKSRDWEDRVSRVHASPALRPDLLLQGFGRVFVVFTLFTNGTVSCHYAYEDDFREEGHWASEVRDTILNCINATDLKNGQGKKKAPIQGYYDFSSGKRYCRAE